MSHLVQTHLHNEIYELKLFRAPVNALNKELCDALTEALQNAVKQGAKGIIISGTEGVFSAGLDVPQLLFLGDDKKALLNTWEAFFTAARAIASAPVPVVAAITGHSPAGGCVFALCCDYRIMAQHPNPEKSFTIGLNETQVGLAIPEGIQYLLRRVIGQYRAERLLLMGEMLPSDNALTIGLVDEVVAMKDVIPASITWLNRLAKLPRQPMLETRKIARADLVTALHPDNIQLEQFIEGWFNPDTQAALKYLVSKLGK